MLDKLFKLALFAGAAVLIAREDNDDETILEQCNVTPESKKPEVVPSTIQEAPNSAPTKETKEPVYPKRGDRYVCPETGEILQARALGGRSYHKQQLVN